MLFLHLKCLLSGLSEDSLSNSRIPARSGISVFKRGLIHFHLLVLGLVDRLWTRGLTKEVANIDLWPKELSPSTELRRWYNHEPSRWQEFKRRYFAELSCNAVGAA